MRVWAKIQWSLKFFEKTCIFTYENLNGKLNFSDFLSYFQGPLSFYTPLETNTIFYNKFFSISRGDFPTSPLRAPLDISMGAAREETQGTLSLLNWKLSRKCWYFWLIPFKQQLFHKFIRKIQIFLRIFITNFQNFPHRLRIFVQTLTQGF